MFAYVSTNEAQDGKFRKIEVRVRNSKAVVNRNAAIARVRNKSELQGFN
jgi:hypothetical protein